MKEESVSDINATPTTPLPALQQVLGQLDAFKRKFYLSLLVRGALVAGGLLLTLFLVLSLLEYFLYLPTWVRGGLLFGFLGLVVYTFMHWIWQPLAALTNLRRLLSDEQAAQRVGELFPQVQDKLLNALQLQGQARENALIAASLEQRAAQFTGLEFSEGIKIKEQSRPLWKYVAIPAAIVLGVLLVYPSLFVQGTGRILNYRRAYSPPAPFEFIIENKNLQAFRNEDFKLQVRVEGAALPNEINIRYNGREQRLTKVPGAGNRYSYEFRQLQRNTEFQLVGAGFTSEDYDLTVRARPDLRDFVVRVAYPTYLGKPTETIRNSGNLTVPEGSTVRWEFATTATDELQLLFKNPDETVTATANDDQFQASRRIMRSQEYAVRLRNAASLNRDPIQYQITAIPDQVPEITLEAFSDTTSLRYLALGGNLRDDYGFTRLQLHYRVSAGKANPAAGYKTRALPLESGPSQAYAYQWDLSSLNMKPGDRLEYFVQVWDNDGVRGPKSARTRSAEFKLPARKELREQLNAQSQSVQNQLSKSSEQSKKLERELAKTEDKLKTKRELNFQDRKQLQDMLEQKQQMDQQLADMKKMFEEMNQRQDQLDPKSQELAEKAKELEKLMETLLDPETKKLYEELQKLLEKQQDQTQPEMQKLLQQLENKENTLQKELERALEMFKQLQFEQKQENVINKLDELAKEQQKLAEQTQQNDKSQQKGPQQQQKQQELQKQQAEQKQEFNDVKKDLQDLKKLDDQLDGENGADEMKEQQQQVEEDMQDSQEQLGKNQNQKASQSQQSAAQKMEKMAQQMREQQEQEEGDKQQENIDSLRDILENLLKISFDQEGLMKDFRQVDQTDPRFVQLGQTQRKLKDDAAIVQDSLYTLAKKVFQIQSFVTREVGEMNNQMDESLNQIRQRNVPRATNSQQLAMTSMNNLALMLNDALQQMQEQQRQSQQNQQGDGKPGKKKKKGQSAGEGQMGRMQQQLNQQIQQLQQSGKQGRELSEELAKLAGQQQMLREALKELDKMQQQSGGEKGKGQEGQGGTGDLKKLMEQTETDLVNKRLTEETVMRQRQILTRLLEAEKSARERDLDDKREAQTAQAKPPVFPPAFEQYKRQKERQTELLRTVPPALTPYYQREVSEYFQKMK
ncbi:DUF4175 family protein [Hymenobacter sp. HD11105]